MNLHGLRFTTEAPLLVRTTRHTQQLLMLLTRVVPVQLSISGVSVRNTGGRVVYCVTNREYGSAINMMFAFTNRYTANYVVLEPAAHGMGAPQATETSQG